jgi:hypothetical protein
MAKHMDHAAYPRFSTPEWKGEPHPVQVRTTEAALPCPETGESGFAGTVA